MDNHQSIMEQEPVNVINTPVKKQKHFLQELLNYVLVILVAFVSANLIHRYLFTPVIVDGISMHPTLKDGDILIMSRTSKIEAFDFIVFRYEDKLLIKRVIGMPGDQVSYVNNRLFINGAEVSEPYLIPENLSSHRNHSFTLADICYLSRTNCLIDGEYRIPEGYYLVLGDNRKDSLDSRGFGLVSQKQVEGEAVFRLKGGLGKLK